MSYVEWKESGTYMFMGLDKPGQERLLFFGIVTATKTASEGRVHAKRMVQEMKDEFPEPQKTLLATASPKRPSGHTESHWSSNVTLLDFVEFIDKTWFNPQEPPATEAWVLMWDVCTSHTSRVTVAELRSRLPHVRVTFLPPGSTSHTLPCDISYMRALKAALTRAAAGHLVSSLKMNPDAAVILKPAEHDVDMGPGLIEEDGDVVVRDPDEAQHADALFFVDEPEDSREGDNPSEAETVAAEPLPSPSAPTDPVRSSHTSRRCASSMATDRFQDKVGTSSAALQ